ncbi:MAG TPA: gliding motility-associated C-terminal domain-containing protein, partial [Mucilaginibacter sp.]|nr:gliding motility-associated C-terminal domain-containing protein [Mucilaginibacter sp.]
NTPACSGQNNGSINISTDALVASVRWVNSQGQNMGSSPLLNNVSKGTYQLYFTDANGCETLYNTYTVTELPPLTITSQGQTSNDQCGLKTGGVTNITITGGQYPYTYTWTDANGNQIGSEISVGNLSAGNYHLNIADSRCGSLNADYTITSQSTFVAAPSVSDVQLCSSGDAFISVNNLSSTFTYRLYDDQNSAQPLDEEKNGRFKVTVSSNRSYFISQLNGTCESSRSELKITVGMSAVSIPNAFTPNGDGINDYWSLKGMENNPNSLVQILTRYGQKVFESKGYEHPFDGTYGGKELPTGVYYYIINLGTNCNILSGNVTLIR